jgi:hypothetical protein
VGKYLALLNNWMVIFGLWVLHMNCGAIAQKLPPPGGPIGYLPPVVVNHVRVVALGYTVLFQSVNNHPVKNHSNFTRLI